MLRFIYDWAILAPANLVAGLTVLALGAMPIAAGIGTWIGIYKLFATKPEWVEVRHRWQLRPAIYAWVIALYVLLVTSVSLTQLPKALFRFLKD